MSRQRRATSSPRRRPVNAAVRNIAASCSLSAARTSAHTSSGENTSIAEDARWRGFSTGHRVVAELVDAARTHEDAVEHRQQLDLGAVAHPQRRLPGLDPVCRHVLEPQRAERRHQVRPDARAILDQRRGLAVEVVLQVAQPLLARLGERHARAHHPR